MSYLPPSEAAREKFHRTTGIRESTAPFEVSVVLLGRMIQEALALLSLYSLDAIDGLLCDTTLNALQRFYVTSSVYKLCEDVEIEAKNWASPALFAALLEAVDAFRGKLRSLGYAVVKSTAKSEVDELRRQIKHFQKAQGLKTTMVFDPATLERITKLCARTAATSALQPVATTVAAL
ncbi:hypothetical protein BDK51DRAFT_44459, partial [Blyttiomyces helicus]